MNFRLGLLVQSNRCAGLQSLLRGHSDSCEQRKARDTIGIFERLTSSALTTVDQVPV